MVQILNQFAMTAEKGQLTRGISTNVITCRLDPASVETFAAAAAVKLVDSTSNEILVELAAPTDSIYGFIKYQIKGNEPVAGDRVEVAFENTFMIMEAAAAIAVGDSLEIVVTGNKVTPSVGTNNIVGVALTKATADGDLIEVMIKSPLINQI